MPLTFAPIRKSSASPLKYIAIVIIMIVISVVVLHIVAMRRIIKVGEDEDYRIVQKNWADLSPSDVAHRHFYYPFVIHFPFAPAEDTLDELNNMGVRTFLHSEPTNFAVPLPIATDISATYYMRHSGDKMMIHAQYPILLEMVSNPGIYPSPFSGTDENIKDISEFVDIVEAPAEPYSVKLRVYPNNLVFIPRGWLFRIICEEKNDGLLEFFIYHTIFSRYL